MASQRLRRAVRALVMDDEQRVLLVRLEFPAWAGWVLPGGGIEEGEADIDAIRRELLEEIGLTEPDLVGPIWERTVLWDGGAEYDGQLEHIFLFQGPSFEPAPHLTWDRLRSEGVTDMRWWTRDELEACPEAIHPTGLCALLAELAEAGPPSSIVIIGE